VRTRASGGPVRAGEPYLVGEEGPELIVPEMAGTVLTAAQTSETLRGAVGGDGASLDMAGLRADIAKLTAAVATARPINITETASPRRTAEQLVVHESRLLRMAGI